MLATPRPSFATALLLGALPACVPDVDDTAGGTDDTATVPLTVVAVTEAIAVATTWTADNLYRLDADIAVTAPLTLEPGTIVKLGEGLAMSVEAGGSIVHDGDADHRCVFTSLADDAHGGDTNGDGDTTLPAPGDWESLAVRESGSVFDHCLFLYGGSAAPYAGAMRVEDGAAITVTNSTFAFNRGGDPTDTRAAALHAAGAGAGTVFADDTFYANELPLVVGGAYDVDDSHTFSGEVDGAPVGNTYDGVWWGGAYELEGDVSWTETEVPFVIPGPLGVPEGGSFTLGEGVVIKLDDGERIDVAGALIATGVLFTSLRDDAAIGDTNGDGQATTAAPGDWGYVAIGGEGTTLDGCFVTYAGSASPYTGAVSVDDSAPTLIGNTFAHNAGGTFTDNRAAALHLGGAGAAVVVVGNRFYDNGLPMAISGDTTLDDSNTFRDESGGQPNALDAIAMDGTFHAVHGATSWAETDVAIVLYGTVLTIEAAGALTLGDDVVVKSDGGRIDVIGALEQGEGVWFTSLMDDTLVGDSNGDGAATSPAEGDWSGVNLCQDGCAWASWGNILYAAWP